MQEIDPVLIRVSLEDRVRYLKDFIGFNRRDVEIIKQVAPVVSEIINDTVERLYANLFEFDITKKIFMERNDGFDGEIPERLEDLKLDSPQLIYRKVFMRTWCRRVLTADYSSGKVWTYMDKVGIMHTGAKAFKHRAHVSPLHVPYRDCALTLGWVQNVLHTAILSVPEDQLSMQNKITAVTAFNKVLWIQNDLFARHYIPNE
ncbi:Protoglobin-domain-containing protein [Vararia minispora EC-137]|uniref:Protoglobin-domain-containing protein n=1 Tax=Vararia minispora EC-137 TaxID=1314806 RepID=A0ACB8QEX0_9AGAM|nr:Protoglobin-domain-containing protein [Vararia minispora EC-137]